MKKNQTPVFCTLIWLLAAYFLFGSCQSTQKFINSGNYDRAIARTVNKLRKNKSNKKQILLLKDAYEKANRADFDQIDFLKKESETGNAYRVFQLYEEIKYRQYKIKPLMPLYIDGQEVNFVFHDIDNELINYKKEAAAYLYDRAIEKLKTGDKYDAREAYALLYDLREISPGYKDVDKQMSIAYDKGLNWVLYEVTNRSPNIIPVEFEEELYAEDFTRLKGSWYRIEIQLERTRGKQFDFVVEVRLNIVNVGAEKIVETNYEETKEIDDGFEYKLDKNGNVIKDSDGNAIKFPKTKTIKASVTETAQTKPAVFKGKIELRDLKNNQLIKSENINVTFMFEHYSATASGNLNALKKETKDKLGNRQVPFPSDFQMIMDGSQEIKPIIRNFIKRYDDYLEG
jgi:hypothetical protein